MKFLLRREPPQTDCTLGLLTVGDLTLCTIERPWIPSGLSNGGQKGVSCVPPGVYQLVRHDSEAHPKTWALVNEGLDVVHYPGDSPNPAARTAVLIHPANRSWEVRGCIAPGTRTFKDPQGYGVANSRKAMKLIQDLLSWDDSHSLEIIE